MRAAVAAGHAEVDQQLSDRFGGHRRAPVGVQGELVGADALPGEGLGDEGFGQLGGLGRGDHPRHDLAAEDVDDHIQVVVDAAFRSLEFRYIPAPNGVRRRRDQLGFLAGGVGPLECSRHSPASRRSRYMVEIDQR